LVFFRKAVTLGFIVFPPWFPAKKRVCLDSPHSISLSNFQGSFPVHISRAKSGLIPPKKRGVQNPTETLPKTLPKTLAKNPRFILVEILAKMLAKSLAKILAKIACKKKGYGRVQIGGEKGGYFGGLFGGSKRGRNRILLFRCNL
jgi:hypothetical protein